MTRVDVAACTHKGLVRGENQDAVLVDGWVSARDGSLSLSRDVGPGDDALLLAVCDGLGGHAGGGVASRLAATQLGSRTWSSTSPDHVVERLRLAGRVVQRVSDEVADLRGLGTTVAGVVVGPDHFAVFNVGDSSVYRAGDGFLGLLSVPDRRDQPFSSGGTVLTQSLSRYTAVADPHVEEFALVRPVRLIVCSDGLTDEVEESELRAISAAGTRSDPARTAEALLGAALAAGGSDNVSVVVVDLEPDAAAQARRADSAVGS